MKINGRHYRAVWMEKGSVSMIDQHLLPFGFSILTTSDYRATCQAIQTMKVRGAGSIGAAAGFAMAQAFLQSYDIAAASHRDLIKDQYASISFSRDAGEISHQKNVVPIEFLQQAKKEIESSRPTARDLFYTVEKVFREGMEALHNYDLDEARQAAVNSAQTIADQYVNNAKKMGLQGAVLIKDGFNILTHCNAGWLALVDYGSALAPVYQAVEDGKKVHVWVDETRPRSQGARLTAWELHQAGIPHTIIADNAAAYLMSKGKVDLVITGADRIAVNGDAANKIGTLEKAILAREYNIPFYIAAPLSTFDKDCPSGNHITIEERAEEEIIYCSGPDKAGNIHEITTCNPGSQAYNPAFDVTPAALITSYITEKGVFGNTAEIFDQTP